MHTRSSAEYARLAKGGFGIGFAMLLVGVLGEVLVPIVFGSIPGWEATLFFDLEVIGVLTALISPFLFGIFLPLVE
ncbi:hypothetical protein L593_10055 [Salinarchaeum sp. Harcht-Bsk1]|uniref:DUF7860 family protein n=1 Tax=Salinarchaeum sp. Harcht-Bsk1 TaxID=1333523 RepID=UPI00034235C7|nr:hypothetical protein [Salinarchaeum sp. Harcht-Bsk1]AGN01956.1 hypothetical protein L593_10055 [Salinarchaeum sp. Harcht-Bsk1]